ncbi:MAG: RnfABCDGE type electron transport complex subunit D [Bacilli bacterium]|nr:RnfABCDGE type electron transport complex subunit D [Bacilli bacterium]
MQFAVETSPHIRRKDTAGRMLLDVIIGLSPVIIFSFVAFQFYALRNLLIPVATMLIAEYICVFIRYKAKPEEKKNFALFFHPKAFGFKIVNLLGPIVSGLIYGLMFPAQDGAMYFYILPLGAIFGTVIAKLLFGGFGNNIFNPAAVGFIFAKTCFASQMNGAYFNAFADTSITAGATTLGEGGGSLLSLLLGTGYGAIGEVCKIAIAVGLIYLLIRRVADWRVVVSYGLTFTLLMLVAGLMKSINTSINPWEYWLTQILSGGFLFALAFMMTDPVTMPITPPSRVYFGMIGAIAAVLIRLFAGAPEGVAYGILIANLAAPALDYYKWSKTRFGWKHFLGYGILLLASAGIIAWGLSGSAEPATGIVIGGLGL